MKLYFMLGLPTETEEDIAGIADLANKVAKTFYEIPKGERPGNGRVDVVAKYFFLRTEAHSHRSSGCVSARMRNSWRNRSF